LICAALKAVIGAAVLLAGSAYASAIDQPSDAQMLDALKAKRLTRCPHVSAISGCDRARSEHASRREPRIDLEITFEYDSAVVGPEAVKALAALGRALADKELEGATFLIAGHTDAKGGDAYNQALSERRAEAVKEFLVEEFKLPPDHLLAVGYGKERLKNSADPFGPENRRVQVVNLLAQ
jgi:outer membrane protein OmpA-like peptidoglycan-associated protein